ncbi:high affinity immunoglobulin gamma Fc receptor I-like [Trichomycterus rosablanca]|uniref:high affinity immunoglobulin gamma Fc receptor I-like n=1 Tax=Trichomycterus rosablanca TaxID=2290929 RepID=UPI002F351DCA
MHILHICIVFSALLASVGAVAPTLAPIKAKATVTTGEQRLFSGEDVQLTCGVPDDLSSSWMYQWFHDGEPVNSWQVYHLRNARVQQSGSYTCEAQKGFWPNVVTALQSDPINVHVDGGWVLLRAPVEPLLIEETMTLTCRVRNNPVLSNAVFYKNGNEFARLNVRDMEFPSLKLEDRGTYSCRATWVQGSEYHSALSVTSPVKVLDKVNTPRLEFSTGRVQASMKSGSTATLKCVTKINAREPGLSLEYYFMKNGERLRPVSAQNTYFIPKVNVEDSGIYTCKIQVRGLLLERWSNQAELKVHP